MKLKFTRGFTLLELLVVISIIAILIAMSTVAFTTAQRRGRDAKRRGDLDSLQKAFEQYYAVNGGYDACATMVTDSMPGGLPTDPKPNHDAYAMTCDAVTDTYCVCALLEETGGGNSSTDDCTAFGTGDYHCVTNLQ